MKKCSIYSFALGKFNTPMDMFVRVCDMWTWRALISYRWSREICRWGYSGKLPLLFWVWPLLTNLVFQEYLNSQVMPVDSSDRNGRKKLMKIWWMSSQEQKIKRICNKISWLDPVILALITFHCVPDLCSALNWEALRNAKMSMSVCQWCHLVIVSNH